MTDNQLIMFAYLSRWGDSPEWMGWNKAPADYRRVHDAIDPHFVKELRFFRKIKSYDYGVSMLKRLNVFKEVFVDA